MAFEQEEQMLLLKHGNPINGMLSIGIVNLSMYWQFSIVDDDDLDHKFTLLYTFNGHQETQHWNVIRFGATYIEREDNTFQLKVPMRLLSYSLQYTIQYQSIQRKENSLSVTTLCDVKSKKYTIQIPSMLIESSFNIGDCVLYNIEGYGYVSQGFVLEILPDDMIKIQKRYYRVSTIQESKTLTIHSSKVSRETQDAQFVVDITDRKLMECDLILRTDDKNIRKMFNILCEALTTIVYDNTMFSIEDEDEIYHANFMANCVSICISQYLYVPDYTYRFKCIFCDDYLYYKNQWEFSVVEYYEQIRNGIQMTEIQRSRDCVGYSCDICRVELSWYEYTYHCYGRPRHDFCVSCMHSVLVQQNEMGAYLAKILKRVCTDDCIREIVKFCIGTVLRF